MKLRLLGLGSTDSDLPLFVFLPGMDGTGRLYLKQSLQLRRFFDLRSLSISSSDRSDWHSLSLNALRLITAEVEGKSHPTVYLCGESFGACLALKIALLSPKLFERLILINPASSFARSLWLGWAIPWLSQVPPFLYWSSTIGFLPFLAATDRMTPAGRRLLLKAMQSVPQATIVWRLSLLQQFTCSDLDLSLLPMSVLLIASTGDRLLPSVEEVKRLSRLFRQARVKLLPASGHACLLESQVNLTQLLEME